MSKVYVLIKDIEQPNDHCLKKGTEFKKCGDSQDHAYVSECGRRSFHPVIVENPNSEWFKLKQEEKSKEWEIISTCPVEDDIYSVRRLSDMEVFTIGDKFEDYTITRFKINGDFLAYEVNDNDFFYDIKILRPADKKEQSVYTDTFQWTDELVYEAVDSYTSSSLMWDTFIEKFKKIHSKSTPKEEKIEVTSFQYGKAMLQSLTGCYYGITVSQPIPPEKYEAVKKAIQFVLNDKTKQVK